MITGTIKNKVDKIWLDIFAGGMTNPLTVIEQLTYLMFIRSLDEKEQEHEAMENLLGTKQPKIFPQSEMGQSMRWSRFKNQNPQKIFQIVSQLVFPAIKNMRNGKLPEIDANGNVIDVAGNAQDSEDVTSFSRFMEDAMFLIPTPQVLQKVISGLDDLYTNDIKDLDMQGDIYEYMLGKLSTAGQAGQFRTPKQVRDMMVKLVNPTPDDLICDPACGTAGFLISSCEYIRSEYGNTMTQEQWDRYAGEAYTGFDMDRTMLRISAMNLMLHSITHPQIEYRDSVSKQNEISNKYDVILAIIWSSYQAIQNVQNEESQAIAA